ncbi:hypothetical protein JR316_0000157 [Psilocybe cubensis]|uniref:Uncharacterized protein n=2 Tax=Psilocybe cubensis TaxID=181762 RepID=A0A8H8CQ29_PSICU|nr:hypothetical protein JR316_0000157 [Psilocybe cubensis]KAH9486093.1 hypothetical protein JR316_0000157 [Psilocybe cubensis]
MLVMDMEDSSVYQPTRDTCTTGSSSSFRENATMPPNSAQAQSGRRISGPRRIRSAESAVFTHRSHSSSDQGNKDIVHRRTTSVETIRSRFSISKNSTDEGSHETTLLTINSAGAIKHKLKSFLPSSVIFLDFGVFEKGPRKPTVENSVDTKEKVSVSKPALKDLNVDQTHHVTATGAATYTTPYLSIDVSDDLSCWDMDYLPPLPSSPGSAASSSGSTIDTTLPSNNAPPFSAPIEDDELLENEIPFPLNRHSKVVMENMGVKKAKTLARSRSESGVRTINRPSAMLKPNLSLGSDDPGAHNSLDRKLTGLPDPLPLRTLCQNREPQHPLGTPSATVPMLPVKVIQSAKPTKVANPSASKQDAWGCMHLGAADCELSIVFPQTSHFEVWDMGDNSNVAFPVMLCIMAKDPQRWSGKPLSLPDVSLIDIRCEDIPFASPMSRNDPQHEYATYYSGCKTGTANDDLISSDRPQSGKGISQSGITLDGKWTRTYTKPGIERNGRTRVHRRDGLNALLGYNEYGGAASVRGWYLQFWIPIPTRLFEKRETRAFNIHARVWMMGDEQRALSLDKNGDGQVFPLLADAEMTVSHLRREREMDRLLW